MTREQPENNGEQISRPGVSQKFLLEQKIVRVSNEQAQELLGFRCRFDCAGFWIPYHSPFDAGPIKVQGRAFGRVRLENATKEAKYLSPKNSGGQTYVPLCGGPFRKELVICEGEFKAIALCEAGIRAVAIGGISSAMHDGVLIRDLAKLIDRFEPKQIKFLGDGDTALNYEFSREAVKLARALPTSCVLSLPRIPIGMPNGIDDCREQLGDEFLEFWERINNESIIVDAGIPIGVLAVKIVKRELSSLAQREDREQQLHKLSELASWLDPLGLESLSGAVHEAFDCSIAAFREAAKQVATERKAEAAAQQRDEEREQSRDDVAQVVNDPRPKIEVPASRSRLSSEFASELGRLVTGRGFFAKDGIVVCPDTERASLVALTAIAFRTKIEDYVIPFKVLKDHAGDRIVFRTLSREEADTVLHSEQFIKELPTIRAVNNLRLPVVRASGTVELLPEGYDVESMIFTTPGGPQIGDPGEEDSAKFLRAHFDEFCFQEGDRERATSVAIAAMLTLFAFNIIPRGALRPGFLYTANAEGGGKTLLARLAIVPRIGVTPTGSLPEQEEEIQKRVFAAAIAGSPVLFFDNGKRHVSSGSLESALTASFIEGRILGKSQMLHVENMMTVFLTGNGATISGDLRRRLLHIELFLREAKAEYRQIENPIDEFVLRDLRPALLSALWGITLSWAEAGRPAPKLKMSGYEPWSEVVCGILEHSGFKSPCTLAPSSTSGDRETEEIEKLVELIPLQRDLRFCDLVELCRKHSLFARLVGEDDEEFDKGKKNILARIFTKFDRRIFRSGRIFHVDRQTKDVTVFYVQKTC